MNALKWWFYGLPVIRSIRRHWYEYQQGRYPGEF